MQSRWRQAGHLRLLEGHKNEPWNWIRGDLKISKSFLISSCHKVIEKYTGLNSNLGKVFFDPKDLKTPSFRIVMKECFILVLGGTWATLVHISHKNMNRENFSLPPNSVPAMLLNPLSPHLSNLTHCQTFKICLRHACIFVHLLCNCFHQILERG